MVPIMEIKSVIPAPRKVVASFQKGSCDLAKESTFFLCCCRLHRLLFDPYDPWGLLAHPLRDGFDAGIDLADATIIFTSPMAIAVSSSPVLKPG